MPDAADQHRLLHAGSRIMESLGRYLTTVAAAAIICSVLEKFSGKGSAASATIKMMCGIFMVLTVVNTWLKLRVYDF